MVSALTERTCTLTEKCKWNEIHYTIESRATLNKCNKTEETVTLLFAFYSKCVN